MRLSASVEQWRSSVTWICRPNQARQYVFPTLEDSTPICNAGAVGIDVLGIQEEPKVGNEVSCLRAYCIGSRLGGSSQQGLRLLTGIRTLPILRCATSPRLRAEWPSRGRRCSEWAGGPSSVTREWARSRALRISDNSQPIWAVRGRIGTSHCSRTAHQCRCLRERIQRPNQAGLEVISALEGSPPIHHAGAVGSQALASHDEPKGGYEVSCPRAICIGSRSGGGSQQGSRFLASTRSLPVQRCAASPRLRAEWPCRQPGGEDRSHDENRDTENCLSHCKLLLKLCLLPTD